MFLQALYSRSIETNAFMKWYFYLYNCIDIVNKWVNFVLLSNDEIYLFNSIKNLKQYEFIIRLSRSILSKY